MTLKVLTRSPTETTHINCLLYGGAGTGKSTAAASVPEGIWFWNTDLDNALSYARSRDSEGRILEVDYSAGIMATMIDVVNAVTEPQDIASTVAVDTVGELHRRLMEEASGRAIRPHRNIYGDTSVHIERFARALCEAPINAVFVCHEHGVKDEGTGEVEHLPWTGTSNPALGSKLMAMVDVVAYCGVVRPEDKPAQYLGQLIPDQGRRGKDRFDVLGAVRELNLAEWMSTIAHRNDKQKTKAPSAQKEKAA